MKEKATESAPHPLCYRCVVGHEYQTRFCRGGGGALIKLRKAVIEKEVFLKTVTTGASLILNKFYSFQICNWGKF